MEKSVWFLQVNSPAHRTGKRVDRELGSLRIKAIKKVDIKIMLLLSLHKNYIKFMLLKKK